MMTETGAPSSGGGDGCADRGVGATPHDVRAASNGAGANGAASNGAGSDGAGSAGGAAPGGRGAAALRRGSWVRDVERLVQNLVADAEVVQRRAARDAERVITDARKQAEAIVAAARQEAGVIGESRRARDEARLADAAALRADLQNLSRAVESTLAVLTGSGREGGPAAGAPGDDGPATMDPAHISSVAAGSAARLPDPDDPPAPS